MPVSQELLDILVCPLDKSPVKLTPDGQGLKCLACHRVYPIRSDIPVMLADEARVEAE
ncbi:MAG: Trm112 family protein [Candidatus Acidiferrales bacterium]